jgi:hypothetical protein
VQMFVPIGRDPTGGPGRGLVEGVMLRRRKRRPSDHVVGRVVPEPVLAWLEAMDHPMTGVTRVVPGVLRRGRVAAADVAAPRAASKVEPPAARRLAVDAARPRRWYRRIDLVVDDHRGDYLPDRIAAVVSSRRAS